MYDHATITRMADIPFPFGWYSLLPGTSWLFPYDVDQLPPLPPPDPAFRPLVLDINTTIPEAKLDASRARVQRRFAAVEAAQRRT
jgi:hypothetical protein